MRHTNATNRKWPALLAACFVTALVAGCAGPLDSDGNRAPVARLSADRDKAWTGQQVTFDLSESYDPDGHVEHYVLDLGDGTTRELDRDDNLRVTHTYARGGDYMVQLTVTDDAEAAPATDKQTVQVIVNERQSIAASVLKAGNLTGNVSEQASVPFTVASKATGFELVLNATNSLAVGGSEIEISVRSPVGDELAKERVTLASGATVAVDLSGSLSQPGSHTVRVTAIQGGASVEGELRVLYA